MQPCSVVTVLYYCHFKIAVHTYQNLEQ